jgi:protein-S-isoprenylcysteine O-methyltransferase Ste14
MRAAAKTVAVFCYALALAGAGALALLVVLLGLDAWPVRTPRPGVAPWLVDVGWLVLFGGQHSGMARQGFKAFWTRLVPARLERSLYAALSGLVLLGLAWTWQPVPGEPFWTGPPWISIVAAAAALGLVLVNLRFDHAGLFGLRQAWETTPAPDPLLVVGPYRYLRHPLMACLLVFLWTQPVMSPTLALLGGGLTAYIVAGIILEERDLLRRFGPAYTAYRRRVPALVPWRKPAPRGVYPALTSEESSCCLPASVPSSSTRSAP